ncbi:MAG: hypothetical protein QGG39_19245, partial [Candidatus Poribacteria bacterium]|nr:hypothetical protein [Candidatus Poribacteria bacterium]
ENGDFAFCRQETSTKFRFESLFSQPAQHACQRLWPSMWIFAMLRSQGVTSDDERVGVVLLYVV